MLGILATDSVLRHDVVLEEREMVMERRTKTEMPVSSLMKREEAVFVASLFSFCDAVALLLMFYVWGLDTTDAGTERQRSAFVDDPCKMIMT